MRLGRVCRHWPSAQSWLALAGALCLLAGVALFSHAVWLQAKARLAQYLIADAWVKTLAGETRVRPWPWADTWPTARLTTPDDQVYHVLEGMSGQALAFGPARLSQGGFAGEPGSMVVAGHQDSHFRFLKHLKRGDLLRIQTAAGHEYVYRVRQLRIADSRREDIRVDPDRDELILITCYPFGAGHYGSPHRYVVKADPA